MRISQGSVNSEDDADLYMEGGQVNLAHLEPQSRGRAE